MISRKLQISLVYAVIGFGLAADGRGAYEGGSRLIAVDGPDGSLAASLIAGLMETAGSTAAYAQSRRDCRIRRGNNRDLGRLRLCVNRVAWNFSNTSDNNFDPVITPDGRYIAFASLDNLDGNPDDIDPEKSEEEPFPEPSSDIFLLDLQTGVLRRVSVNKAGRVAAVPTPDPEDGDTPQLADFHSPAVSANGQLVAFVTNGALLPRQDTNREGDVYLKDLSTGKLTLITAVGAREPALGGVPRSPGSSFPVVAMSDNGRFMAFMTTAALDPERDHNNTLDVNVKNLRTGRFYLASIMASIDQRGEAAGVANPLDPSDGPPTPADPAIDISGNGRFVGVTTLAALDPADLNGEADVYVWDRRRPYATPVLASGGEPAPTDFDPSLSALSSSPALSFNGRFIAFESSAGLVDGDDNDVSDVYRYDRVRRVLVRASLDSEGRETAVDGSFDPAVSATGRFVAFSSAASDLLVGDTNLVSTDRNLGNTRFPEDIFVKDIRTGAITRASLDEDGIESDGTSFSPSLSADGRLITFVTDDSGLIEPDPDNDLQGDSVVVTEVGFQLPPLLEISGDPAGAVSIQRNFELSPGGGIVVPTESPNIPLDFALRNQIEQPGDQDWFRVFLFAGRTYTIDLEGAATGQGTLGDPLLRVFRDAPEGAIEDDSDDDGGVPNNARLAYETPAEGTFYISAEGFQGSTGTYRLLVRESETSPTAAAAR